MQFKVPQKIDMEDKIIGPLTMKQFVYLLVGGMIAYATIKSANITLIAVIGVPVAIFTLMFTFIKVQDQPFSKFLLSLALFSVKSKRRAWVKDWQTEGLARSVVKPNEKIEAVKIEKHVQRAELEKLANVLDTRGKI